MVTMHSNYEAFEVAFFYGKALLMSRGYTEYLK